MSTKTNPTRRLTTIGAIAVAIMVACVAEKAPEEQPPPQLGPVDGFDLAPTEIERVAVGTAAPDFSLTAVNNEVMTLSEFRGNKNVVLVFYRGHW